jgi:hypothetical protein
VVEIVRACEAGELGFDPDRLHCMLDLTSTSNTLLAGSLEHAQKKQIALTRAVAARMGLDPLTDLRPHVVASTALSTFHAAAEALRTEKMGYTRFSDALDDAFAVIEGGLNFPSVRPE